MAVLEIKMEGDPILRQRAKPVRNVTKRTQRLIKDMAETMYAADGIGLAAPQIGISERIIVVDAGEGLVALINPSITMAAGSEVDVEGCLSIPGIRGYVERARDIRVEGLDERGKLVRIDASALLARVFQHEIDHLDGILFTDKATGLHAIERTAPERVGNDEERFGNGAGRETVASEGDGSKEPSLGVRPSDNR